MRMHHLRLVPYGMSQPMFQRSLLLPSSWETAGSFELMVTFRLHGDIPDDSNV
jgi:hypothetical protein